MNNEKALAKNVMYNTVGTFIYFFCQWLITIIVVRLGDYHNAGILSLIISITNIFFCISLFGIRNFQVSDIEAIYSDNDYLYVRIVTTAMALSLFLLSLYFFKLDMETLFCALIYIVYKCGESFSDVFFGSFQRYSCYRQIAISYILKGILTVSTFAIALYFTKSLFFTLLVNIIVYFAVLFIYDIRILKEKFKFRIRKFDYKKLLKICFPLMLYSSMVPYLNFITRFIVEKEYGTTILGYYSSVTMVFVVMSTLMNSIFVSIIPKIASFYSQNNGDAIKKCIKYVITFIIFMTLVACVVATLFGNKIFTIVFGEEIIEYMFLLIPTILASILLTIVTFYSSILIAFNMNKEVLYCNLIAIIICTCTVHLFVNKFALSGTLYSLAISLLLSTVILAMLVHKKIKYL